MIAMEFSLRYRVGIYALLMLAALGTVVLFPHIPLLVLIALLWIDKMGLELFTVVSYLGIEIATFVTILLGLLYGPVVAGVVGIICITAFHSLKYILLPFRTSWPVFVPSPTDIIHTLGGVLAAFLTGFPLFIVLMIVMGFKTVLYALYDMYWKGKPVDVLAAALNILFNLIFFFIVGIPLAASFGL